MTDHNAGLFPAPETHLGWYDVILVNSSGGKDSQVMLGEIAARAAAANVSDRVVVVHCDLGIVEWDGTRALAQLQAELYGFRFEVVSRPQGDLLQQIEERGMWPSSSARYCTSDQKRGQVRTLMTSLVRGADVTDRPVRILNCMGLRAAESSARAKKLGLQLDPGATNGKRTVVTWLPILDWSDEQVWAYIDASGVPYHPAYDEGMSRLSCSFCVLATRADLVRAARLRPALAARYVALEARIGHRFKNDLSMADVVAEAATGPHVPGPRGGKTGRASQPRPCVELALASRPAS